MTPTITTQALLDAYKAVVAESPRVINPECKLFDAAGRPVCVAGHVLHRLGIPARSVDLLAYLYKPEGVYDEDPEHMLPDDLGDQIYVRQLIADRKAPWGWIDTLLADALTGHNINLAVRSDRCNHCGCTTAIIVTHYLDDLKRLAMAGIG